MTLLHFLAFITAPIWILLLLLVIWCITTAFLGALVWLYIRSGKRK